MNKNNVFIVNSINTAIICLILSKSIDYDVIIEHKDESMDEDVNAVISMILEPCANRIIRRVQVPDSYFLLANGYIDGVISLLRLKKCLKSVLDFNCFDKVYMSDTSTFKFANIKQGYIKVDHGTGDYYSPNKRSNPLEAGLKKVYKTLFLNNKINSVYSMYCRKNVNYVDIYDFEFGENITKYLDSLSLAIKGKKNVLWMPTVGTVMKGGFKRLDDKDVERQIDKLSKIICSDEYVLIKHHQAIRLCDIDIIQKVSNILSDRGIKQIDVSEFTSDMLFNKIPAEMLIKYYDIKKIVADESSVFWNLSRYKMIKKYTTLSHYDNNDKKYVYVKYLLSEDLVEMINE